MSETMQFTRSLPVLSQVLYPELLFPFVCLDSGRWKKPGTITFDVQRLTFEDTVEMTVEAAILKVPDEPNYSIFIGHAKGLRDDYGKCGIKLTLKSNNVEFLTNKEL